MSIVWAAALAAQQGRDAGETTSPGGALQSEGGLPLLPVPRTPLDSAHHAAVQNLMRSVESLPIGPNLSVSQFLDATGGRAMLADELMRAERIGGPRPLDEKTMEVRLELHGKNLADILARIAKQHASTSPCSAEFVLAQSNAWNWRSFSASGVGTSSVEFPKNSVAMVPPDWATDILVITVTNELDAPAVAMAGGDQEQAAALAARAASAEQSARRELRRVVLSLQAFPGQPVSDLTAAHAGLASEVDRMLAEAKVVSVTHPTQTSAQVKVRFDNAELWERLRVHIYQSFPASSAPSK